MKKVIIIGGGYTGLGCAYFLGKTGKYGITVLKKGDKIGGLAGAFKMPEWKWPIEKYIHHWFTNDEYILQISKELDIHNKLIIKNTKSSILYNGKISQFDSPTSLLRLPFLSLYEKFRMGIAMFKMKMDKNFLRHENKLAFDFIDKKIGKKANEIIWKPLFYGKFGKHAPKINAAWFCGRVYARTKNLMYMEGGFETFAKSLGEKIESRGDKIEVNADVKSVKKIKDKFEIIYNGKKLIADIVILSVPFFVARQLYNFPKEFSDKYSNLNAIGSQYFVLELNNSLLKDGTYWLNINEKNYPFMVVCEHTNFISKKNYDNKNIVWIGKYLDYDDPLWSINEKKLLEKILPYLKKINPDFDKKWISRSFFFREKNTQHITPVNYSKEIPPYKTPIKGLYLGNIHQVYPFDRETNYSLRIGDILARIILRDDKN